MELYNKGSYCLGDVQFWGLLNPMKLIALNCPNCGAHLTIAPDKTEAWCEHCDTSFLIEDESKERETAEEIKSAILKRNDDEVKPERINHDETIETHLRKESSVYQPDNSNVHITQSRDGYKSFIGGIFSATGIYGYHFCYEDEIICTASSGVGPFSVRIHGFDREWEGDVIGLNDTRYPGRVRKVIDLTTGEKIWQLKLLDFSSYLIDQSLMVSYQDGKYLFTDNSGIVGETKKMEGLDAVPSVLLKREQYAEYQGFYKVFVRNGETEETILKVLSFLMIKF